MRMVKISIRSAKVVNTSIKTCQNTSGRKGEKVESLFDLENLIHQNHISNMLHLMMDERPVSSKRPNGHSRIPHIDDIASNGLIRINNVYRFDKVSKDGKPYVKYNNSINIGKKATRNPNRKNCVTFASNGEVMGDYITWAYLKRAATHKERYQEAINVLNQFRVFLGKQLSVVDLLVEIRNYPEWKEKLFAIKDITPLTKFVNKDYQSSGFNKVKYYNKAGLATINGVYYTISIDADVILFVSDEDAIRLLNGKRNAGILESGVATLITDNDSLSTFEFIDDNDVNDVKEELIEIDKFTEIKTLPFTKNE